MLVGRHRLCHSDLTSLGVLRKVEESIDSSQRQRSSVRPSYKRAEAFVATGKHVIDALYVSAHLHY